MKNIEQQKEDTLIKKVSPPYLSATKIEELMRLVANRNLTNVSADIFETYGFNASDAILAVTTLRFLGVIDNNGKATDLMSKLRLTGETGKKELEKIVRSSYKKIFDATDAPQNLPADELVNEMLVQYSNISQNVAKSASRAFLKFCVLAGLKEESAVVTRKRSPKTEHKTQSITSNKPKKTRNPQKELEGRDFDFHIPVVENKMYIEIPESIYKLSFLDDKLHNDLRMLVKEAREFADKHIPKEKTEDEGADNGG
ncbi:MAG TPA: DUF5343 domain-containing protein [Candidatus Paceibacterota bacterium]|nr:MAG: hypothetical protein UV94_C0010G0030 [Parcubacteria group bacterium GW2011_GWC1_43_30]KKT79015.1 MAG: hypothetical protein UW76_C0040G0004 [Parcubacteria group bacterium GW2011_GWF2_44_8b]